MPEGFAPIGVEAIARGVAAFQKDLQQMGITYDETCNRFRASSGKFESLNTVMGSFTNSILGAASGTGQMSGALAGGAGAAISGGLVAGAALAAGAVVALKKGIDVAVEAGKQLLSWTVEQTKASMQMAGRFEEMRVTALAVGRAMGLQKDEIEGGIAAMQEAGIRYDVAAKTAAQFARYGLDMAQARELVNIAQATGIIIDEDSSSTMERLVMAITTGSTIRLRYMGIIVDNTEAEEAHAASIDKSVDALSGQEKMQARVNAIIEQSASLLDVYTEAMKIPTKLMRTLAGREIPTLQAAFGQYFNPAWYEALLGIQAVVQALTEALSEGGKLRPFMIELGAVALWAAQTFRDLAESLVSALGLAPQEIQTPLSVGTQLIGDFATGSKDAFEGTFGAILVTIANFGANLVILLADALINAMDVIVQAMNAMSKLLASWLAPGSDPKVAPLSKWGAGWMTSLLGGFTKADFGVLKAIQGPLKKVLGGPEFVGMSKRIMAAVGAGALDPKLLADISALGGEVGPEIAKLAQLQFDLADATEAVAASEAALEASRRRAETTQADWVARVQEYNQALREGEDEAALAAKLEAVQAAEDAALATAAEVTQAEAANEEAKAREETLKAQVDVQQEVIDQLFLMRDALAESKKAADKASESLKGAGDALRELKDAAPTPADFQIDNALLESLETAKEKFAQRMEEIFAPVRAKWDELELKLAEFQTSYDTFSSNVEESSSRTWGVVEPILEDWRVILGYQLPIVVGFLRTKLFALDQTIRLAWIWVRNNAMKIIGDFILRLAELKDFVRDKVLAVFGDVKGGFLRVLNKIAEAIESVRYNISLLIGLFEYLKRVAREAMDAAGGVIGSSPSPMERGIRGASAALREMRQEMMAVGRAAPGMAGTAAYAAAPAAQTTTVTHVSRPVTVTIGPIYLTSGQADAFQFQLGVERAVRQALATS